MIGVVCFKWGDRYRWEHVSRLRDNVARFMPWTENGWRFVCATDDPTGCPKDVIPAALARELIPLGNAYPKLQVFSEHARELYGSELTRLLVLDVDISIVGPLGLLFAKTSPVVMLPEFSYEPRPGRVRARFNSSVMLLTPGANPNVWDTFYCDPARAVADVGRSRIIGSDQAWLSMALPPNVATFEPRHGVRSYRFDVKPNGPRPSDIVHVYHGRPKPWDVET